MIDCDKLKQAKKLLNESGADYVLGYDNGESVSFSASMTMGYCNNFDSMLREIIMGATRIMYRSDGESGAPRSLDRMSTAVTHARRETWFRAGEERVKKND